MQAPTPAPRASFLQGAPASGRRGSDALPWAMGQGSSPASAPKGGRPAAARRAPLLLEDGRSDGEVRVVRDACSGTVLSLESMCDSPRVWAFYAFLSRYMRVEITRGIVAREAIGSLLQFLPSSFELLLVGGISRARALRLAPTPPRRSKWARVPSGRSNLTTRFLTTR